MKRNITPLFQSLLDSVRLGDLEQVSSLVSNFSVELNAVDAYDYSPLILASLCGHIEVVKYLLQNGAILERDTFDGARCLYGALNDEIRDLLLKHDASIKVDVLQPFAMHLTALRRDNLPCSTKADTTLRCQGSSPDVFEAHKFLLSARSAYFRSSHPSVLRGNWRNETEVTLPLLSSQIDLFLRFIYLDNLDVVPQEAVQKAEVLSTELGTPALAEYFSGADQLTSSERQQAQSRIAQDDLEKYVRQEVVNRAWLISDVHACDDLARDKLESDANSTADSLLMIPSEDGTDKLKVYPVHKNMLIKSEYFTTALSSGFAESQQKIPVFTLELNMQVAEIVLVFLYTDRVQIPRELALDVLEAASFLLLSTLKQLAAISLTSSMRAPHTDELPDGTDIYSILRIGWRTETQRLEQFAAKYLARHLDDFLYEEEFRDIVVESAARILNRQETDTIELVDDIRYYLGQNWGIDDVEENRKPGSAVKEEYDMPLTGWELRYNEQLSKLDELLASLSLDA